MLQSALEPHTRCSFSSYTIWSKTRAPESSGILLMALLLPSYIDKRRTALYLHKQARSHKQKAVCTPIATSVCGQHVREPQAPMLSSHETVHAYLRSAGPRFKAQRKKEKNEVAHNRYFEGIPHSRMWVRVPLYVPGVEFPPAGAGVRHNSGATSLICPRRANRVCFMT